MKTKEDIVGLAVKTLTIEANAISNLIEFVNNGFAETIELIAASKGRVVITGIGKSAIIGNKIVATLNSTGTPAIFMHAADAIHGDLGNVQTDDVVICISKSGETQEVKTLVPLIKGMGNRIIGMTGNVNSFLATQSDHVLNTTIQEEACPNNLAPTSSTTAQLAMGDALAVCLLDYKGFSDKDFAKYHPGGALGKRLHLKIGDLLNKHEKPTVQPNATISSVIVEISSKRLGAAVVEENGNLLGIITDGDIRRMLGKNENFSHLTAKDIMSANPKTIQKDELATAALQLMEANSITQLIVTEESSCLGIVHLHDILKEGIV